MARTFSISEAVEKPAVNDNGPVVFAVTEWTLIGFWSGASVAIVGMALWLGITWP